MKLNQVDLEGNSVYLSKLDTRILLKDILIDFRRYVLPYVYREEYKHLLLWACNEEHLEVIKFLLTDLEALILVSPISNYDCLSASYSNGNYIILEMLLCKLPNITNNDIDCLLKRSISTKTFYKLKALLEKYNFKVPN